jgi:multidrug transporter EmrE-like cation transporter
LAFAFTIANRLYGKYALNKVDSYALAISTNILGVLITLPFAWGYLHEIPNISSFHFFLILVSGILWTYISWAGNLSVAQNNYSFKEIIRQTRIIWVVLAGIFLLNEEITRTDIVGVVLIVGSVFIISYKQFSFREHVSSKAILLAWSVSFLAAAIAIIEKEIVDNVTVIVYMLFAYALPSLALSVFLRKKRTNDLRVFITHDKFVALVCAVLMFASYYCALKAYQLFPIAIAYPIIQSSTVVGMLIGTYLFEENEFWFRKLVASAVAICGVILIKLL